MPWRLTGDRPAGTRAVSARVGAEVDTVGGGLETGVYRDGLRSGCFGRVDGAAVLPTPFLKMNGGGLVFMVSSSPDLFFFAGGKRVGSRFSWSSSGPDGSSGRLREFSMVGGMVAGI